MAAFKELLVCFMQTEGRFKAYTPTLKGKTEKRDSSGMNDFLVNIFFSSKKGQSELAMPS